jgi:site-specific DNA recombinase
MDDVALYARVSSDAQDTDLSLTAQLRAMREHVQRLGDNIVREFVDEAKSGRTDARPAFKQMIGLAKSDDPPFCKIYVWKLNRFARSREDSVVYKSLLRRKGIEVVSINEPVDDSPAGRLLEGMIESVDEFYSASMGQDIKRGMRENARRGFFNGSRPPYGFQRVSVRDGERTRHRLEPMSDDSTQIVVVRKMFQMILDGKGCKEVAKQLNSEGYTTTGGAFWGKVTVHKILTNEAYKGTLVWGGRAGHTAVRSGEAPTRVESAWTAIIDADTFDVVRSKLKSRRPSVVNPRTVRSRYLLSGFPFCSCGSALTGSGAKSGRYYYYSCSRAAKQGKIACESRAFPKLRLERAVLRQLQSRILSDDNIDELVRLVNEEVHAMAESSYANLKILDRELGDVERRLARLYDSLETGMLSLDDLAPRIKELRSRQDGMRKSKIDAENDIANQGHQQLDATLVKTYAKDLGKLLAAFDPAEGKNFIRSIVRRIEINEGTATMHYRLPMPPGNQIADWVAVPSTVTRGGDRGTRTPNLGIANAALSQLSYIPTTETALNYTACRNP